MGHRPPCPNLHYLPLLSIKQISAVQRQFQLFRFSISVISFLSLSLFLYFFCLQTIKTLIGDFIFCCFFERRERGVGVRGRGGGEGEWGEQEKAGSIELSLK